MFQPCKYLDTFRASWRQVSAAMAACLLFSGVVAAQSPLATPWQFDSNLLAPQGVPMKNIFSQASSIKAPAVAPVAGDFEWNGNVFGSAHAHLQPDFALAGPQRITLQQAQQQAAGGTNPMVRLGQLQVKAAKHNRLAARGDYFPKISASYARINLNKPPGQVLTPGPNDTPVRVNILDKNLDFFSLSGVQPITPLSRSGNS